MLNPKRKKPHIDRKRAKKRYFLVEFITSNKGDSEAFSKLKDIYHDLINSVEYFWGLQGRACFKQMKIKHLNALTKIAIVVTPFAMEEMFRAIVPLIKQISRIPCTARLLHVSGTILQIQKRIFEYNKEVVRAGGREIMEEEKVLKLTVEK